MDKTIERSLVLGLTRIFTEYGWYTTGHSPLFSDKLETIRYGLYHGDALAYRTHLRLLIQAREKDGKWGLFSPIFVNGIESLLTSYGNNNDLFAIKAPELKQVFQTELSTLNVFKHNIYAKEALKRLKDFGRTNIRYTLVEEYGLDRLRNDLHAAGFKKGTVTICYDSYEPNYLCDPVYDDGSVKMFAYFPLMPIVLLTDGKKR